MAYTFTDATLLSYQLDKNYLGQGILYLNGKANITIKGIFDNRLTNSKGYGVKATIDNIKNLLLTTSNVYDDIIVNNFNLGKGIITNISFPKDNPIIFGDYSYDIEVIESTDFSNISTSSTTYGSVLYSLKDLINNFDEKFDFNYAEDGTYTCKHSITLQYFNDKTDIIAKCKSLASTLFNENLSLGLIGKFAGAYASLKTKKNYYSESYDLVNKTCTFTKEIEINQNTLSSYSNSISHSLTFSENGKITIEEQGLIKALDDTQSFTAENYFNTEINNSFSRCQQFFNNYVAKYSLGSYDSLINASYELGKTINLADNSLGYSVSYTNDLGVEQNLIHTYSKIVTLNQEGVTTVSEEGEITLKAILGTIVNLNQFKVKYLTAKLRIDNDSQYAGYNKSRTSINYEKIGSSYYGNKFTYRIEKNNEKKNLLTDNTIYKSLQISVQDSKPAEIYKEYIIANRTPKNVLFTLGNQVEMGTRTVQINGTLAKPASDVWSAPRVFPLTDLKTIAINNGLVGIGKDAYISDVSYSHGSTNDFSFSMTVMYLG